MLGHGGSFWVLQPRPYHTDGEGAATFIPLHQHLLGHPLVPKKIRLGVSRRPSKRSRHLFPAEGRATDRHRVKAGARIRATGDRVIRVIWNVLVNREPIGAVESDSRLGRFTRCQTGRHEDVSDNAGRSLSCYPLSKDEGKAGKADLAQCIRQTKQTESHPDDAQHDRLLQTRDAPRAGSNDRR